MNKGPVSDASIVPDTSGKGDHGIDRHMLEALVCPMTHGTLTYDPQRQELVSKAAHLAYPIRSGIPIMLEEAARQLD